MTYSLDLRRRVVNFVKNGGSKVEASRRYEVSRWCVHDWCTRDELMPKTVKRRKRKLDWDALKQDVKDNPNALLRERAERFGVNINAIWYALKEMKKDEKQQAIESKKNNVATE